MINLINEIAGSNSNNIFGSTRPAGVTLNVNIVGADSEPNNFSPNDTLSQTLLSLINQLAQQKNQFQNEQNKNDSISEDEFYDLLKTGKTQIENGQFKTNEQVMFEAKKWLNEKL